MQNQFGSTYACEPPVLGDAVDLESFDNTEAISHQQLDLIAESFACGVTNVASIMYRRGENDYHDLAREGMALMNACNRSLEQHWNRKQDE